MQGHILKRSRPGLKSMQRALEDGPRPGRLPMGVYTSTKSGQNWNPRAESPGSSELILAMGLDRHIRGRVGDAREAEAVVHLVVVQEGLVRLVDRAFDDLARAARA